MDDLIEGIFEMIGDFFLWMFVSEPTSTAASVGPSRQQSLTPAKREAPKQKPKRRMIRGRSGFT